MSALVAAHAGHWLVQVLYFAPILVFVLWLSVSALRQRRRDEREGGEDATAPPSAPAERR